MALYRGGQRSIIGESKPILCFFENVRNHINIGFDIVCKDLQDLGYRVEAGIFNALEIGAPHLRERLFILAVDNTICQGLERFSRDDSKTKRRQDSKRSVSPASIFPAPQSLYQKDWEEPRINFRDESSLGFTINGYNFREDLLRMAGNGVVEQTAELAFLTLLKKFE